MKYIKSIILMFISAALLIVGVWMSDAQSIWSDLIHFPVWALISILLLFSFNLLVVSSRLWLMLKYFGVSLPIGIVTQASVAGHLAGIFFISLFGQVAGRHAFLKKFGVPAVLLASLIVYERVLLLIVSASLCLFGAVLLLGNAAVLGFLSDIPLMEIALASVLGLCLSLWIGKSKFESKLISSFFEYKTLKRVLSIGVVSFVGQLSVIAAFVLGILVLNPEIGLLGVFAAAAITSFAASLPISVNGWGVREVAAIYTMGEIGVSSSNALTVSVLIGLCSMIVVFIASPVVFKKFDKKVLRSSTAASESERGLDYERLAAWVISTGAAIFIFFQIHISLPGGLININLADPFAILALAVVAVHCLSVKSLPQWRVPDFNLMLLVFTGLLLTSFVNGVLEIGVTQWALAGRLMGWLVLLGYLSVGYLVVSYLGRHGVRRFSEILISTAVVIIVIRILIRWLDYKGLLTGINIPLNFQGYSGNRNAFAFQVLVCSLLLLSYTGLNRRYMQLSSLTAYTSSNRVVDWFGGKRGILVCTCNGVLLAGLLLSGSRAGFVAGFVLVVLSLSLKLVDYRMLFLSVLIGFGIWGGVQINLSVLLSYLLQFELVRFILPESFQLALAHLADGGSGGWLASKFSTAASNIERWETIRRGFELWLESPVFGAGLGVFIDRSAEWFANPIVIHSTPVWILAELGLFGALVLIWIFVSIFKTFLLANRKNPTARVVLMLLVVFSVFGLVHEMFYQRLFWLVLGAGLAVSSHVSRVQFKSNDGRNVECLTNS